MALNITEAAKLSNDVLVAGVVETIVKEGPLIGLIPWVSITGTAMRYNRENALPASSWRQVGDTWTEDTPTYTEKTTALKILGGDADVDQFLARTYANVQDLEAAVLEGKAKGWAHELEEAFFYGTGDNDDIDGLHDMITNDATGQVVHEGSGTTAAALALSNLDEMIDKVKPGKPDVLLMSRRTRRGLSVYARALTSPINYEPGEFGQRIMFYDGIPILVSDHILDTETIASGAYDQPTGGSATSIFAVKFGETALHGIHNGSLPTLERVGNLETKDAARWRVKGYMQLVLKSTLAIARIDGISSGAVTAT